MNLFDQFKREIPKNQQLVGAVCDSLLNPLDENAIKTSFSSLVEELLGRRLGYPLDGQVKVLMAPNQIL